MSSNSPTSPSPPPANPANPGNRSTPIWRLVDTEDDPPGSATGEGTRYTCPDCGGVLFERREGLLERFECSVGHVFSIESLSSAQADALENALWAAVRSLEDRAALLLRLAVGGRERRQLRSAVAFERHAARRSSGRARSARPSRAPRTTARSRLSRERAGRAASLRGRVRDAARRPPRVHQAHPRLRLHRLQAAEPRRAGSRKRMQAVGVDDYADYLDYLEVHPDEFTALFNTILINVTSFFRDPPAWEYLRERGRPAAARGERPPTSRSASGAPAAPPARRRTRSRWCSPRRWAPRRSASG